jgi:hypothetical protein
LSTLLLHRISCFRYKAAGFLLRGTNLEVKSPPEEVSLRAELLALVEGMAREF